MSNFTFKNEILHIDDVSALDIEKKCKTPVYIYSEACLINNYRKLEVWQIGIKLTKDVYQYSDKLPPAQRLSIISQMQRILLQSHQILLRDLGEIQTNHYPILFRLL